MSRALHATRAPTRLPSATALLENATGRVFTGAALHVRVNGAVVEERATGVLTPGGAAVTVETPFDLASITKVFSGSALLALFDRRKLALDDPVVSVMPEFAGHDPRRTSVTFRHLLAHASGLPAHVNFRDEVSGRAVIARVCATPLQNAPGSTVVYSDLGFMLVGAIVERLAGRPLAEAIDELVIAPLGATDIGFNPPGPAREHIVCTERDSWRGRLLQGEVHDENCWSMGGISGHAGLFAPAAAVADLGDAYREVGVGRGGRMLSRHAALLATREAAASDDERRGLAWALRTEQRQSCGTRFGPRSFGHTGYTGTSLWVDPDRALVVALLTNRVYFTREPQPIFELRAAVHDAIVADLERGDAR